MHTTGRIHYIGPYLKVYTTLIKKNTNVNFCERCNVTKGYSEIFCNQCGQKLEKREVTVYDFPDPNLIGIGEDFERLDHYCQKGSPAFMVFIPRGDLFINSLLAVNGEAINRSLLALSDFYAPTLQKLTNLVCRVEKLFGILEL